VSARHRPLLEICVDSAGCLAAAIEGGADRIELCSALSLGGLTPSPGLLSLAADAPVPVRAMIRPRAGGFVFDAEDLAVMRRDIAAVRAAGLAGVVIGAATRQGRLDMPALRELMEAAEGLAVTLHRVVDLLDDPLEAVNLAADLGVDTILTSGGVVTAEAGVARIAAMGQRAAGRVAIMAGGGVRAANVAPILDATEADAIHASCARALAPVYGKAAALGFSAPGAARTDAEAVAHLRAAVDAWAAGG
jgi:copper homeostasis protein